MPELTYFEHLSYILPEVAVTLGLCLVLCWEMFSRRQDRTAEARRARGMETGILSLGFLAIAGVLLLIRFSWNPATVFGMVEVDRFGTMFKLFITSAVAVVIGFDLMDRRAQDDGRSETYFLLLTAVLGSYFLVSSYNFLLIYLGLETLGLASYALSGMHKRGRASAEAALKYVVYGALASGIMLFGASLLYGLSGTLQVDEMAGHIVTAVREGRSVQVALPTLLILVGFGFKLSFFPFHWWAPDVYEGVPTPIATFLAVGSKGVALAAFLRVLAMAFAGIMVFDDPSVGILNEPTPFLANLGGTLAIISAATMLVGNLAALRQTNLKRLLAYSSIAHAGYIMMGVAVLKPSGFEAATLYTFIYYFMNLGAFGMVLYFANQTGSEDIGSLKGMGYSHPWAGVATIVFLASLTGLPPTAGFAGKWILMMEAWDGGLGWLALWTGLMSVVSLFFYFRIAKMLFLRQADQEIAVVRTPILSGMLVVLAVFSVVFLYFDPLLDLAKTGINDLFY
ncbi:MAG: NADH-quinone oxidoreductase subunit N [Planctomycetota bacterium]|nr:MAG: NADH-quinone oxidoreductase subunit N [Planctomycetota bacterium]